MTTHSLQEAKPSDHSAWLRRGLTATAVGSVVAGTTYYWLYGPKHFEEQVAVPIRPITDEVFDTEDNLVVFFVSSDEEVLSRRDDMQRVVKALENDAVFKRLSFYYNLRIEGDPALPADGTDTATQESGAIATPPLRAVLYKGQRRHIIQIGTDVPADQIRDFFVPVSQEIPKASRNLCVPFVSGLSFATDVLEASSLSRPVLVQLFEDTCFLCFLMRPFVNSVAELLAEHKAPLTIKRLNIEKNDFPDGCPVARGTPTFVLHQGATVPAAKWDEFKPKDFVEKLSNEFPNMPEQVYKGMEEYQALVSSRFQLFTQLVMWTVELGKLEEVLSMSRPRVLTAEGTAGGVRPDSSLDNGEADAKDDQAFNVIVSKMMSKDMQRTDNMTDNLEYLRGEVEEVEHDAVLMGAMVAEAVIRLEQSEEPSGAG